MRQTPFTNAKLPVPFPEVLRAIALADRLQCGAAGGPHKLAPMISRAMGSANVRLVQEKRFMPTLVLIRHGQSAWNLENRFTGWWDVDLTEKGVEEARAAGQLLSAKGLDFDCCFTSVQTRAIKTLNLALEEMGRLWLPVEKDWRLNERHQQG
jgi:hypothetical protein